MGKADAWLRSDLERVKEHQVANFSGVYLADINFYFEGSNQIQAIYRNEFDYNDTHFGWAHGIDGSNEDSFFSFEPNSFNLSSVYGWLLQPVAYFDRSNNLAAFQVTELQHSWDSSGSSESLSTKKWVMEGFTKEKNATLWDDIPYERKQQLGSLNVFRETACEPLLGQEQEDVHLVGFASTTESELATRIKSIQAIYFTTNEQLCNCLPRQPAIKTNVTEKQFEIVGKPTDLIDRLDRNGYLDYVIFGVAMFVLSFVTLIVGATMFLLLEAQATKPTWLAVHPKIYKDYLKKKIEFCEEADKDLQELKDNGMKSLVNRKIQQNSHQSMRVKGSKIDMIDTVRSQGSSQSFTQNRQQKNNRRDPISPVPEFRRDQSKSTQPDDNRTQNNNHWNNARNEDSFTDDEFSPQRNTGRKLINNQQQQQHSSRRR